MIIDTPVSFEANYSSDESFGELPVEALFIWL